MTDQAIPPHRTQRNSLTKAQLRTELGAELLSLCQSVTADGRLAPEEIQGLRTWLADADAAELPAALYLKEVVERVLADGQITPDEFKELHKAVETVLPTELRRQAVSARKEIEEAEENAARSAKQAKQEEVRRERERNRPAATANFMVAGVRHDGRPAIIERYANSGDAVSLIRDPYNEFSSNAIAVQLINRKQIGFVPEEDAERIAPLLDLGHRADARIVKILGGGRSPIPVVQAYIMRPDADPRVSATVRRTDRAPSKGSYRAEAMGHSLGKAASKVGLPIVVAVGVGLLVLLVLVSVLTGD